MDQKIKAEWFDKLRSNQQGQGSLRRGHKGCCWGWLCEVGVEHGVIKREDFHKDSDGLPVYAYRWIPSGKIRRYTSYPPDELLEWAGIPKLVVGSDSTIMLLAGMNDADSNFEAIMSVIEELFGNEPIPSDEGNG